MSVLPNRRTVSLRAALRRHLAPATYGAGETAYARMEEPPESLIDADGVYPSGWYSEPPAALNLTANKKAGWRRLHRWFFLHFDSADYFVGANLIDLRLGGNVAIIVLDKRTGEFTVSAETRLLMCNAVEISDDCRAFSDQHSGSFISISPDDRTLEFDLTVKGVSLKGKASALFQRPFVQSTKLGDELGTLQSWGNLTLDQATLVVDGKTTELPSGLFGAYDRSLGHRRLIENWNWIATCGEATRSSDGKRVPFAFHAAVDRPAAKPQVDGKKFALWVDDAFVKLPDLEFEYTYTNERKLETSVWRISSDRSGTGADCWVDLTFTPRFHRRDAHRIPLLFNVDHSQYFGEINGEICIEGEVFTVSDVFATTEDSMMIV